MSTLTTTLSLVIPQSWVDYVTRDTAVFGRPHQCGYWAYGAYHTPAGWLVYVPAAEGSRPSEEDTQAERRAWKGNHPAAPNWYRWDRAFALRAYVEGVRFFGEPKFSEWDGPMADYAIQQALFGKQVYG